jgi:hypothetical protein
MQPVTKLRSLNSAKRMNGVAVVKECATKK